MALDVTAYAKTCRILAQALQEIGGILQDAAERSEPEPSVWKPCARCGTGYLAGSPALCAQHGLCAGCHHEDGVTPRT
jgi:hypothetical protein